jgi:hypothetical protein
VNIERPRDRLRRDQSFSWGTSSLAGCRRFSENTVEARNWFERSGALRTPEMAVSPSVWRSWSFGEVTILAAESSPASLVKVSPFQIVAGRTRI